MNNLSKTKKKQQQNMKNICEIILNGTSYNVERYAARFACALRGGEREQQNHCYWLVGRFFLSCLVSTSGFSSVSVNIINPFASVRSKNNNNKWWKPRKRNEFNTEINSQNKRIENAQIHCRTHGRMGPIWISVAVDLFLLPFLFFWSLLLSWN